MHQELHWLDIPERLNYKLGVLTHQCLLGKALVIVFHTEFLQLICDKFSAVEDRMTAIEDSMSQLAIDR